MRILYHLLIDKEAYSSNRVCFKRDAKNIMDRSCEERQNYRDNSKKGHLNLTSDRAK